MVDGFPTHEDVAALRRWEVMEKKLGGRTGCGIDGVVGNVPRWVLRVGRGLREMPGLLRTAKSARRDAVGSSRSGFVFIGR